MNENSYPSESTFTGKIAVHLHLHYLDLLPKLGRYLANIPYRYDLYLSITEEGGLDFVKEYCVHHIPNSTPFVKLVPNKGRDVKPFYTDLNVELAGYDYICHIHGKKSIYNNGFTSGWLDHLMENLLGSEAIVRSIIGKFEQENNTGLIYPNTFEKMPYWVHNWLSNVGYANHLKERLKLESLPKSYFCYPIGNMFWARRNAIKPIFDLQLLDSDYPPEAKQNDGEIMHALERMTPIVSKQQGFQNFTIKTKDGATSFTREEDSIDFSNYFKHSIATIKHVINWEQITTISFDIFDTLICRSLLDPDDLFDLMQEEFEKLCNQKVRFRKLRREADAEVRSRLAKGKDVTLDDIYRQLGSNLKLPAASTQKLMQLELSLEKKVLVRRESMIEAFDFAVASGKKVILASDMYLSKSQLHTILSNLGIKGYHEIYVSASVGHRKDTRELFPHILKKEGLQPSQLLHIGDNEHSDLQIPGDLQITIFHVLRVKELFQRSDLYKQFFASRLDGLSLYSRISLALCLNKIYDNPFTKPDGFVDGNLHQFGYFYYGRTLLSFVKWVADKAKEDQIKKLYFISRDGEILYKIYRLIEEKSGRKLPDAEYIELSRRSMGVPFLNNLDDVDKLTRADFFGNTLQSFFEVRMGIDVSELTYLDVTQFGFNDIYDKIHLPAQVEQVKVLAHHLFELERDRFTEEQVNAVGYLHAKGVYSDERKALVDIGYSGTMQKFLTNITGKRMHGYYMVTYDVIEHVMNDPEIETRALFGNKINPYLKELSIDRYSLYYEMILSSVNGPVKKYLKKEKTGQFYPIYEPVSSEEQGKMDKLPVIHEGILKYCSDFMDVCKNPDLIQYDQHDILLEPFTQLMEHPKEQDINMINGLTIDDHYCGNGIFYWVPKMEDISRANFNGSKYLWKKALEKFAPSSPQQDLLPHPNQEQAAEGKIPAPVQSISESHNAQNDDHGIKELGGFATEHEFEIYNWYHTKYEVLPGWYKKIGHVLKVMKGKKRLKLTLEDKNVKKEFNSKSEEIQAWYDKEYEVLPRWYKIFGRLVRIVSGKEKVN